MAASQEEILQQILEELREKDKGPGATGARNKELYKDLDYLKERAKNLTEGLKRANDKATSFSKMLSPIPGALAGVKDELDALDDALKKASSESERASIKAARDTLRDEAAKADSIENFKKTTKAVGDTFKLGAAGVGGFIKGLQGNESGIKLAGSLMEAGLDMAGSAASSAGQVMGQTGQIAATSTNPRIKALGLAASVAGPLIGMLGENASKLAKFGVQVLTAEVEKTVKAFNQASASGATFANGMTELRNISGEAGLTVDQFSNVLQKESVNIAGAGLGVSEGARRVSGALKAGGDTMKTQLLNLGYGFEEQAELVAQTMKDMRGSSMGPLKASNAEVAEQTQKYAENLRVIAGITGEDAKKKAALVQEQANQLGFQQKLAKMGPEQQAAIKRAMMNMSDIERKNFMDMVNFGTVINKEGAAAMASSQGLSNSVNATYQAFQEGKLDEVEQRKIATQYGDQIKSDMLAQGSLGLAGAAGVGGIAQSLAESMGKELEFRNNFNKEAIAGAEKNTKDQKTTQDELTKSVTGAETAAQDLKMALQKELTPAIKQFGKVTEEVLNGMKKALKGAGLGGEKGDEGPGFLARHGRSILEYGGAAVGGVIGGGVAGGLTAGVGAVPGAIEGGLVGNMAGSWLADALGLEKFANGGISYGGGLTNGGQLAMVSEGAKAEAHVPLPDGKTIPVDMGGTLAQIKAMLPDSKTIPEDIGGFFNKFKDLLGNQTPATVGGPSMSQEEVIKAIQQLIDVNLNQLIQNKEMVAYLRDNADTSRKILTASL